MFERIKNVFNAALGKTHLCGGNCLCNHELESPYPEADTVSASGDALGDFIDLRNMHPDIKSMLLELSSAEKQAELLAELEACEDESACDCDHNKAMPQQCVHLDYIPVCHMVEGDSKPESCSASTCPVRMFQVALAEMQKKAAMIAYG